MTREQLLDGVVRGVCAPYLKDYRDTMKLARHADDPAEAARAAEKGLIEMARRRFDHIRDEFVATAGAPQPICCQCGHTATTRVAGRDYCNAHAGAAPRLAPGAAA